MASPARTASELTRDFDDITLDDVPIVGGKGASCGEMYRTMKPLGIGVLDGFAVTAGAYRLLLRQEGLESELRRLMTELNPADTVALAGAGRAARDRVLRTILPPALQTTILAAYDRLCERLGSEPALAVRSSATAEDLPNASFAGQHESYLNVRGRDGLIKAVHACFASLFTDRAITYRSAQGYDHLSVALAVTVQPMVRSDLGSAGVLFTLDPESGFRDAIVLNGSYGLGEYVVQGVVTPDEWTVFKPTLALGKEAIIGRRLGSKEKRLVYAQDGGTRCEEVAPSERSRFCLTDEEATTLAQWACRVEAHYSMRLGQHQPMDIEWARDGESERLYILQARPETVHSTRAAGQGVLKRDVYRLAASPPPALVTGQAVGERIAAGPVRVVKEAAELAAVQPGDVLVARITDPDWEPVMKRVAAIVTDEGGRTAHAAIVSRELGLPCIVGTGEGTRVLTDGAPVTICCAEGDQGRVYPGQLPFTRTEVDAGNLPPTRTAICINVGEPDRAFALASLPVAGVGLARTEFIFTHQIGIHPMALAHLERLKDEDAKGAIRARIGDEDPRTFLIRRFSEGVARIAAAFYPKPVIVRTSDFKTNEYAQLLGGGEFEPAEENPMLGFRGASRYYDERYADGFALECAALRRVRGAMGFTNVKIMIPFCRTVAEAERVIRVMANHGLRQGENGLEVYAMCEIPSNVVLAEEFLRRFDGYSIGSNDLTQLVLGIDRDSGTVAHLFDDGDEAVRRLIGSAIETARRLGKPIGICGQAPSDHPAFAAWLVERGITSISLDPDSVLKTIPLIAEAEARSQREESAV